MKEIYNLEIIKNYIKENNLSKSKFCKLSRISLKTLHKIFNQQTNLRATAVFRVARTMNIKVYLLFFNKK